MLLIKNEKRFFEIFPKATVLCALSRVKYLCRKFIKKRITQDVLNYLITVIYLGDSFICSPAVAVNHVMSQAHRSALSDFDDRSEIQVGDHQGQGRAEYQRRKPCDLHLR